MKKIESPFLHPDLRQIKLPSCEDAPELKALLGTWVRVVLVDHRVMVGSLKAIDCDKNIVLMNPVEVRPVAVDVGSAANKVETKSHRGMLMIKGHDIVKFSKKIVKQTP